ncbi:spore cortex biosynthesis protein YabQ [Neobacillus mesonae]|nr:spore cortex biosynthesis protein YabQ [Neobacillus mesonae]
MNPEIQWLTLGWMLLSGAMMGVVYDSYRVLSGQLRFPRWSIHILDLMYWLIAALFIFRTLYTINHGDLRFYVFLGLFIGVWVYFLVLSVTIQKIVVMLIGIIKRLVYMVYRVLYVLIVLPIKGSLRILRIIFGFVMAIIIFLIKMLYQIVKPILKLLYLPLRPLLRKWKTPGWMERVGVRIKEWWTYWF